MEVVDVFFYNGERDILRIHLNILCNSVNRFIICEAKTTFSGQPKPLYFFRDQRYFKPWWHMIDYYVVDEDYTPEEIAAANASPNTRGPEHWKREFLQKESIQKAIKGLKDNDIVFIGDVDEIWNPAARTVAEETFAVNPRVVKLNLQVYVYYLNNRSNAAFWGTIVAPYSELKGKCLNHIRSDMLNANDTTAGWHFTSMGGLKEVERKLNDSYTEETYNRADVRASLMSCVQERKDFLGRPFTYTIDESQWPAYLVENRDKYKHLLWS